MKCPNCKNKIQPDWKFCEICGAKLNTNEKPKVTTPKKGRSTRKLSNKGRRLLSFMLIGIVVLFILLGLFGSSGDRIVYGVRESEDIYKYERIYSVGVNGKDHQEIFYGLTNGLSAWDFSIFNIFTDDGKLMQFYDLFSQQLLILNTANGTYDAYQGEFVFDSSFTGDEKHILLNETEGENVEIFMTVVDPKGKKIGSYDDLTFIESIPNGKDALVYHWEYDGSGYRYFDEMGLLNFKSGDYTFLTSLEDGDTDSGLIVSDDGKTIFFQDGEELISMEVSSGKTKTIFDTEEEYSVPKFYISEDNKTMAVIADDYDSTLNTIDLRSDEKTKIDREVTYATFTPDNKGLVYMTFEDNGEYDLYYAKNDGSDKVRLVRNIRNLDYQLSPNGDYVAFLERDGSDGSGDLRVIALDEENPVHLATDVWSFRFTEDNRSIVYSKVEDIARGTPESEIYKIGINGRKNKLLVEADDGIFEILWPEIR